MKPQLYESIYRTILERFGEPIVEANACMQCGMVHTDQGCDMGEVAPPGYEKVVKGLKKNKDVDNPWAVAWSMKRRGVKPKSEGLVRETRDRVSPVEVEQTWEDLYINTGTVSVEEIASWLGSTDEAVKKALRRIGWLMVDRDDKVIERGLS